MDYKTLNENNFLELKHAKGDNPIIYISLKEIGENKKKEKGIIAQEINMYKDDPESRIDDVLRANLYVKNNRKIKE